MSGDSRLHGYCLAEWYYDYLMRVLFPPGKIMRLSFFIVSLSFFLFSMQVHEKSVLLPAL